MFFNYTVMTRWKGEIRWRKSYSGFSLNLALMRIDYMRKHDSVTDIQFIVSAAGHDDVTYCK